MSYFKIVLPKAEEKLKEPYSRDEMEKLLKKPDLKTCRFNEYRNWVMVNYFIGTGNRIATVTHLKIKDLDFEEEKIALLTVKNKRAYKIPMAKQLKRILIEYLSYRNGEPDDFVFCPAKNNKKPMTENGVKTILAQYNRGKGVVKTSCHIYRHYFSKHYLLKRWN